MLVTETLKRRKERGGGNLMAKTDGEKLYRHLYRMIMSLRKTFVCFVRIVKTKLNQNL
jgi:hypothetical protein